MSMVLLHPPLAAFVSGGNIYNRNILQQSRRQGVDLLSVQQQPASIEQSLPARLGSHQLVIADSLFWYDLFDIRQQTADRTWGLLCHYLPSMNPVVEVQQRRQLRLQEDRVIAVMDFVIATGETIKQSLNQRFPELPVYLCEPGVDAVFVRQGQTPKGLNAPVQLLTVANLLPEKGYLDLLNILADLDDHSWQWHIVGSDQCHAEFTDSFRRQADELNLASAIRYHGVLPAPAVAAWMERADIFINASYYEGYGMALAEAAAARLPVVTTGVGAADKLIHHTKNGFIVAPGDWQKFALYLKRLIEDKELRQTFSRNHRHPPRTWAVCFDEFLAVCSRYAET